MRQKRHALGLAAVAVLTGSCAAIPRSAPLAPAPPVPPPVARAAEPPRPQGFALAGAITQGGLVLGTPPPGTIAVTLDGVAVPLAADGRFLIAFGRDAPASALLRARLEGGGTVDRPLNVLPRQWDIQSLPTLPKGTKPTPEFLRRRSAEIAQINAARHQDSDSDGWEQHFIWPATGRISGVFGSQRIYAGEPGSPHAGVDIAQPAGTPVAAPADGVVVLAAASPFTLEGNLLMIDHGMGLTSAFLHLSRIDVKLGEHVRRGQPVGAIGMTGRATGPHLHWAMSLRQIRIDPQLIAGPMAGATGTAASGGD